MDKEKNISRRELLVKLGFTGVALGMTTAIISPVVYFTYKQISRDFKSPYHTSHLVKNIQTLKEIIEDEGEQYFSYPEDSKEKISSIESITNELYPMVKESVNTIIKKDIQYPTINELSIINDGSVIAGTMAVGWFFGFDKLQKITKEKRRKRNFKLLKYFGGLQLSLVSLKYAFLSGGIYSKLNKKVSVDLGNSKEFTKFCIAHELAHHQFYQNIKESYPGWVIEGFADGFAWNVLDNAGLIKKNKNEVRKNSLTKLVSTYKLVCKLENLTDELPKKYNDFDFAMFGFRMPDNYSTGYTFFRIQDKLKKEQKNLNVYSSILINGNLDVIGPLPNKDPVCIK